ncbi:hypothetical protein KY284_035579 [Solanum tuberosum]|nr:hypothetical protein KY284_035579 [Solanum tuberosum]
MASKTNEGADSSVVLTPYFDGTDFEYWEIRMRTHLKAEGLWTIVANGFEEPENDGELTTTEMKNLEAKYRQDAKALNKIQMGVSRAYFAKNATCETTKEAWESLETEVYGDEKVRTINLQTLRREFQNLKLIESRKIDEYCTRVMNIVNKMRNHDDTISDQQVVEKILISVTEKYEYIVAITEETKDLSKLSIKELVGSFRAHEKQSNHMTRDEKIFLSINSSITTKVRMGNGALVDAKGKGTISINIKGSGKQIHDVLYVPDLEENLLSVGHFMENDNSWIWHKRFCHLNCHGLKLLKKKDMVQVLPEIHTKNKVENTSIIYLDVSNQEEDEEEENVPRGGEISNSDDEEPPPRGTKMLSDIYQRCNFAGVEKENYEEAIKHDVWKKALAEKIQKIEKNNTWECVSIPKEREVENNLLTSSPQHFQEKSFAIFEKALELSSKCIKGECWN